ncbi:MAG: sulfatase-like hydrolase/transferase [Spirosomataceae bacterium]
MKLFSKILLSLSLATFIAQAQKSRPNILMILVDDMGYGELGVYGSKFCQTPNLDALAKEGVRFTNFYANSTVCSPTRAALMTGRYPDLVGVPGVIREIKKIAGVTFHQKPLRYHKHSKPQATKQRWWANGTWGLNPKIIPTAEGLPIFMVFWKI